MYVCVGKSSWPELVGTPGTEAVKVIERENPFVTAVIVLGTQPVTGPFNCSRVRVSVDTRGSVFVVPAVG
ncbi:Glu S.griseus protease inhibitor [Salvia divinorum]|uniref:Glu S.griseus protease inhibitor n=1 Tax=Salvia divinorum TaxID=28513 RepID=A0ABD1G577_SALDI